MQRIVKQIAYGFVYVFIIILVIWGIGQGFAKPKPTCFDKIKNQDEIQVDCGGTMCQACVTAQIEDLRVTEPVKVFQLDFKRVVFVGTIVNPNASYRASQFAYQFLIYSKDGNVLERISGFDSAFPQEERKIFAGQVSSEYDSIDHVELAFTNVIWESAAARPSPRLTLQGTPETVVDGTIIRVQGTITNQSPFVASRIKVTAFLYDSFGDELFVSQTIIETIEGFGESAFMVPFPQNETLRKKVDTSKTAVFINSS